MLARSGKLRTFRDNAVLGIALCAVGGFMNAGGLVVVSTVVSHVTGHWTNFGKDLGEANWLGAAKFGGYCLSFLCGAIFSTFLIESNRNERLRSIYVRPLLVELAFVTLFAIFGSKLLEWSPGWQAGVVAYLCFTLGLQNAMLSRLTGGAVRGTHLTGITTDLGIEIVRVWFLARQRLHNLRLARGDAFGLGDLLGELRDIATQEPAQRLRLFVYMLTSFVSGAIVGTISFGHFGSLGALPVVVMLAVLDGRELLELRREIAFEAREKDRATGASAPRPLASSSGIVLPEPRAAEATAVAPAPEPVPTPPATTPSP